jgi:hypothetical protein
MTLLEWPVMARVAGWGKQAWGYARRWGVMVARITSLESRVSALEERLDKQPPDVCVACGERGMRRKHSQLLGGAKDSRRQERWECTKCGEIEFRMVHFN